MKHPVLTDQQLMDGMEPVPVLPLASGGRALLIRKSTQRVEGNVGLGESSSSREIFGGFLFPALLLAGPLLAACASNKPLPEPRGAPFEPCDGVMVLVVVNRTDVEVEIVESRVGSGTRTVIGTVSPGSREFVIRGEPGYTYSSRRLNRGPTISTTSRSRVREQNAVELRRECRAR